MEIFSNQEHNEIKIAIGQPVLKKSKKSQQPKPTDHFIYIQSHIQRDGHVGEEHDIQNNPKFLHGRWSDVSGVCFKI